VFVTVHEEPFPVPHDYSILDVISDASAAQRGFRCCPTARDIKYRETNFTIIMKIISILVLTTKHENAKLSYGRPELVVKRT